MQARSILLAATGAAMLATAFAQGTAHAAPKGWRCGYAVTPIVGPFFNDRGPFYYACFGKSLSETRARARADCRRRPSCVTGACLPLDFTPRSTCGRE